MLGDWQPAETPAAVDAVVERRLRRLALAFDAARALEPEHRARIAAEDFLTYGEYRETLRRLGDLRTTLQRLDNQLRRQDHDDTHFADKPHFYAAIAPPQPKQTALVRGYDPDRHTSDRAGYLAYLAGAGSGPIEVFFRRLPLLIPEDHRQMHTYVTGSSGSGKSELMKVLIHSYARQEKPPCLVILDPHGKFADEVAAQREVIEADRLVYVNPAPRSRPDPDLETRSTSTIRPPPVLSPRNWWRCSMSCFVRPTTPASPATWRL